MATIADIAAKTGLGYSTVAQILQGRSNYRADTMARVTAAAAELGYRPNYLSKSLAGGKSMSIGVYLESTVTLVSTQILYPLEACSRAAGYVTYIGSGGRDERVRQQLDSFLERKIDGLIFHSTSPRNAEMQDFLRRLTIPVVYIDRPVLDGHSATVGIDYAGGLAELAAALRTAGYDRAQLLYNTFFVDYPERLQVPYRQALAAAGIALEVSPEWCCRWYPEPEVCAYETVTANLKQGRTPELLLCYNDQAAVGAMAALRDAGLRVPEDVGVVGRDGLQLLQFLRPPLASLVRPEGMKIAEAAFDMLRRMMEDREFVPEPVWLPVRFEAGGTIGRRALTPYKG